MHAPYAKFATSVTLSATLAAVLLACVAPASARNHDAQSAWVEAYDRLEEAEKAERQDDIAKALNLYRESRKQFLAVHRQDPQWNPSLVNYRIKYCRRKIQSLETELRLSQSSRDRGELVKTLERQADRITELTRTSENLEYKLQITSEALEKARTEAARNVLANHRVPQLLKESKSLEQERDNLKRQVETLRQQATEGKDTNQTVKQLKQQKAELEVQVGETKAEAAEARRIARKQSEKIDALTVKLRLAAQENQALKRQVTNLKQTVQNSDEEVDEEKRELLARLNNAEKQAERRHNELTQTRRQNQELAREVEAKSSKQEEYERAIESLQNQVAQMEEALSKAPSREELAAAEKRANAAEQAPNQEPPARVTALQNRVDSLQNQLDEVPDEAPLDQLRKQAAELQATRENLVEAERAIQQEKAAATALQDKIAALDASRAEHDNIIEELKQTIAELRKEKNESRKSRQATSDPPLEQTDTQSTRLQRALEQERKRARELEKALHEALVNQEKSQDDPRPDSEDTAKNAPEAERQTAEQTSQPPSMPGEIPTPHIENSADDDKGSAKKDSETPLPRETRAYLKEGLRAEETGNTEAASWNYRKVLEAKPDNRVALHRLGLLAAERGDDEKAAQYLRQAARQAPENLDILIPLGYSLARQEKPYEAIGALAQAIAAQPDDARPHRALGVAASSLGWYDIAEREMKESLRIAPDDSDSAFNLAILLASKEPPDMDEARRWYLKARKLSGQSDPALDRMFDLDPPSPDKE